MMMPWLSLKMRRRGSEKPGASVGTKAHNLNQMGVANTTTPIWKIKYIRFTYVCPANWNHQPAESGDFMAQTM
jgi:hypothetical protein